jgi:hypothetical protein
MKVIQADYSMQSKTVGLLEDSVDELSWISTSNIVHEISIEEWRAKNAKIEELAERFKL